MREIRCAGLVSVAGPALTEWIKPVFLERILADYWKERHSLSLIDAVV